MTTQASSIEARFILRETRHREKSLVEKLAAELEWSCSWLAENCIGDGFDHNRLLAGSEGCDQDRSITMSGLVVDGRGLHSHATFCRTEGPKTMIDTDLAITTTGPFPYTGGLVFHGPRDAHGDVKYRDERADGWVRYRNVNGTHEEVGAWHLPSRETSS